MIRCWLGWHRFDYRISYAYRGYIQVCARCGHEESHAYGVQEKEAHRG